MLKNSSIQQIIYNCDFAIMKGAGINESVK